MVLCLAVHARRYELYVKKKQIFCGVLVSVTCRPPAAAGRPTDVWLQKDEDHVWDWLRMLLCGAGENQVNIFPYICQIVAFLYLITPLIWIVMLYWHRLALCFSLWGIHIWWLIWICRSKMSFYVCTILSDEFKMSCASFHTYLS